MPLCGLLRSSGVKDPPHAPPGRNVSGVHGTMPVSQTGQGQLDTTPQVAQLFWPPSLQEGPHRAGQAAHQRQPSSSAVCHAPRGRRPASARVCTTRRPAGRGSFSGSDSLSSWCRSGAGRVAAQRLGTLTPCALLQPGTRRCMMHHAAAQRQGVPRRGQWPATREGGVQSQAVHGGTPSHAWAAPSRWLRCGAWSTATPGTSGPSSHGTLHGRQTPPSAAAAAQAACQRRHVHKQGARQAGDPAAACSPRPAGSGAGVQVDPVCRR